MLNYAIAKGRAAKGREFEIIGDEHLLRKFQHLQEIGTKRAKINAALRRAAKPMRLAARSYAKAYQSDNISARTTKSGYVRPHLWKAISLITSKRYKGVLWIGPRKTKKYMAYHGHILEKGTSGRVTKSGASRGGYGGKSYMRRAYNATKGMVLRGIGNELDKMIKEIAIK